MTRTSPSAAASAPAVSAGEELIVAYGTETSEIGRGRGGRNDITSTGRLFDLEDRPIGRYHGLLEIGIPLDSPLLIRPVAAPDSAAIPKVPILGDLKIKFAFDGPDSVTVVGSCTGHVSALADGSSLFLSSALGLVVEGAGRYAGATGVASISGSSLLAKGTALEPGARLRIKTVNSLRIACGQARHQGAGRPRSPGAKAEPARELEKVERFVDRVANFFFFCRPDGGRPRATRSSDGWVTRVEVRERLYLAESGPWQPAKGLRLRGIGGGTSGRADLRWQPIPEDLVARPGTRLPTTPLDPRRSQRLVVSDATFTFDGGQRTGFRAFGTGRTFPVEVAGETRLDVGAVLEVVEGFGALRGRRGMVVVNGTASPGGELAAACLLRLTDPSGRLLAPPPRAVGSLPEPAPGELFLTVSGEPVPGDPMRPIPGPDGQLAGVAGIERLRWVEIRSASGRHGLRSETTAGPVAGEFSLTGWFDPFQGDPPYPMQTTGGRFTFFDRRRKTLGSIEADMVEGRVFPTTVPTVPEPVYRGGGLSPIIRGSGCFRGAGGMISTSSYLALQPSVSSDLFAIRLEDPSGLACRVLEQAWA